MTDNKIASVNSSADLQDIFSQKKFKHFRGSEESRFNWLANIVDDGNDNVADTKITLNDIDTIINITEKADTFYKDLKKSYAEEETLKIPRLISYHEFQLLFPENPELEFSEKALTNEEKKYLYDHVIKTDPTDNSTQAKLKNKLFNSLLEGNVQIVAGSQPDSYFDGKRTQPTISINHTTLKQAISNTKEIQKIEAANAPFLTQLKNKYGKGPINFEKLTTEEKTKYGIYRSTLIATAGYRSPTTVRDTLFHEAYHFQVAQINNFFPKGEDYSKAEELGAVAFQKALSGSSYTSDSGLKDYLLRFIQGSSYLYLPPENKNEQNTRQRLLRGEFKPLVKPLPLLFPKTTQTEFTPPPLNIRG